MVAKKLRHCAGDRLAVLCAALVLVIAQSTPAQTTRDSAGIQIVDNLRPLWTPGTEWRLSSAPVFRTELESGAAGGGTTRAAVKLSDGRIAVANGSSLQIAFYDATGRHINSVGRRGQGPGEFQSMGRMCRIAGDTLIVHDRSTGLEVFAPNGTHIRRMRYDPGVAGSAAVIYLQGCLRDGTSIVMRDGPQPTGPGPTNPWTESLFAYALDRNGKLVHTFGPLPMGSYARATGGRGSGAATVVFSQRGSVAVDATHFIYGYSDSYEIKMYASNGRLQRIVRRQWASRPVTNADIAAYKEARLQPTRAGRSVAVTPQQRANVEEAIFAKVYPSFTELVIDQSGGFWTKDGLARGAERATPSSGYPAVPSWSVFDGAGRWLGGVRIPAGIQPLEIGADYILSVTSGQDGLQYLMMHRIEKPNAGGAGR